MKYRLAAFDRNILGISPDYIIDVRRDVLGLQEISGDKIHVPRLGEFRPDKERLDIRYRESRRGRIVPWPSRAARYVRLP